MENKDFISNYVNIEDLLDKKDPDEFNWGEVISTRSPFIEELDYWWDKFSSFLRINFKRRPKLFLQRKFRGWDDSDTWDLDHTFLDYLYHRDDIYWFWKNDLWKNETWPYLALARSVDWIDISKEDWEKIKQAIWNYFFWFLDTKSVNFLFPRIKRFKKISIMRPADLSDEKWQEILQQMIEDLSFFNQTRMLKKEVILTKIKFSRSEYNELRTNLEAKEIRTSIRLANLMKEYFLNLWW